MSDSKVKILSHYELELRLLRCESEGRDFITLEPLEKGAKQVYHSELQKYVFVNR